MKHEPAAASLDDARIWVIAVAGPTAWHATNGEQTVELAYPVIHEVHRLEIETVRSTQTHVFALNVGDESRRISIHSLGNDVVDGSQGVAVTLEPDGFLVQVADVGTAWFKRSVGIRTWGFSDTNWEMAMVWLVGMLSITGFPNMME